MMDKKLKQSLANSFAFLDIQRNVNSGIRSYVFFTEHWGTISDSIKTVYNNKREIVTFLKEVELLFFKFPDSPSAYLDIKENGLPVDHPKYEKIRSEFNNIINERIPYTVLESSVSIHKEIKESNDRKNLQILFAFYLAQICDLDIINCITREIVSIQENLINTGDYDVKSKGHRVPKTLLQLLKLAEINLKINKYNYCCEVDKLNFLLIDNFELIQQYLEEIHNRVVKNEIYDNTLELCQFNLEDNLSKSLNMLSKSMIYPDINAFSKLRKLADLLDDIEYNEVVLDFNNPQVTNFRCILFERAKNAYKYGFISKKKYLKYQKELEETDKEQFKKTRKYLNNLNYLTKKGEPPAIRSFSWSERNKKYYEKELKPTLKAEGDIKIDFSSGLYQDYITKYIKETASEAYKTASRDTILNKGLHLVRLYKQYENEFISSNLIKGMLIDSRAFNEYEKFTKFVSQNTNQTTSALEEIISIQKKLDGILLFSGEFLLGQAYWERKKKFAELFKGEIITFLNNFIEENDCEYLTLDLLDKYSNPDYIKSNYDDFKKDWIEQNYNINEEFPHSKKQLIQSAKKLNSSSDNFCQNEDVYHERFRLFTKNISELDFNFLKIPKINIPYPITDLINLELVGIFQNQLNSFKEDKNLNIGDDRWISEKHLYFKIKQEFPGIPIVRHAKPSWLGQQHFDIYIPTEDIAIEYNGRQHYETIEYFGGEEDFKHRKKLDRKKLEKAEENNTKVIIHKYDSKIDDTMNELENYL